MWINWRHKDNGIFYAQNRKKLKKILCVETFTEAHRVFFRTYFFPSRYTHRALILFGHIYIYNK